MHITKKLWLSAKGEGVNLITVSKINIKFVNKLNLLSFGTLMFRYLKIRKEHTIKILKAYL